MLAPISLVCGSEWFLDANLKAKTVSFLPTMTKEAYWILARFLRGLILTKGTDMDLDEETRQEIFLYSSKIDLFPGFSIRMAGYPRTLGEGLDSAVTKNMFRI